MKKYLVVLAAMVMVIAMVSGAYADKSATVSATAVVGKVCTASNDGVINFGSLDAVTNLGAVAASEALVTTKPTIHCTNADTYQVTATGLNGGTSSGGTSSGYLLKDPVSADTIAYTFTYNTPITGEGIATGATKSIGGTGATHLAITPSIAAHALDAAIAGTYGDTITFTIAY